MKAYSLLLALFSGWLTLNAATSYAHKIDSALNITFNTFDMEPINQIINELESLENAKNNRYIAYWTAYAQYKKSIVIIETKQDSEEALKEGKKELAAAFRLLEGIKHKTSEEYALMAAIKNYSIAFASPLQIPFISGEAKRLGQTAIEMDDKNLRAYLVAGIRDYFTPSRYGGGGKFEELFLKAIQLENRYSQNPNDPDWGKNEAYYYLIQHYFRNDSDKAKALYLEAIRLYPDDNRLKSIGR